jgi:hypothetical protein
MSVILCSHGLLDWLNKNYSISAQLYDIINIFKFLFTTGIKYNKKNILPLVEGVMVDDHTLKNISHSGIINDNKKQMFIWTTTTRKNKDG